MKIAAQGRGSALRKKKSGIKSGFFFFLNGSSGVLLDKFMESWRAVCVLNKCITSLLEGEQGMMFSEKKYRLFCTHSEFLFKMVNFSELVA